MHIGQLTADAANRKIRANKAHRDMVAMTHFMRYWLLSNTATKAIAALAANRIIMTK